MSNIDTVMLQYRMWINEEILISPWEKTIEEKNWNKNIYYTLQLTLNNGSSIRFCYYLTPFDNTGDPLLTLCFSIPHVAYGDNNVMCYDLEEAISLIHNKLAMYYFIPSIDLWNGTLKRLDICYDYFVGDLVSEYIKAIELMIYPRRNRGRYNNNTRRKRGDFRNNGVTFYCGQIDTKYYDKFKECGESIAWGILRHEIEIKRKDRIGELLGVTKPTLRDLSKEKIQNILENDKKELGLHETIIVNKDKALDLFVEKLGRIGTDCYLYVLLLYEYPDLSKQEIAEKMGKGLSTIYRWIGKMKDAGLAPSFTEYEMTLPPLEVKIV